MGPAPYLDIDQIITAAHQSGCDAIHPGYGFLSENAHFAHRCAEAGLLFVGPDPATLAAFGDKAEARALAAQCGIPVMAGTSQATSLDEAQAFFAQLGPGAGMMIKAIAGGGMCVTAPDMLRLALVVTNDGTWNGRRIVSPSVIERLKAGGTPRPSLWGNEGGGTDRSYRSQWYSFGPGGLLYAMGIHGQSIFISTEHDAAMVVQSSTPVADGDFYDVAATYFTAVIGHLAMR